MCIAVIAALAARPAVAQRANRQQIEGSRGRLLQWAARNGVLIKGMTKVEVLKVYGWPDKKFNYNYASGRLEQWIYYFPRRKSIFPFTTSPFSGQFRYLYFRNDLLVDFQR